MHWNSQVPHDGKKKSDEDEEAKEGDEEEEKEEESKDQEASPAATEAEPEEPEIEPTYETEKRYDSLNVFKQSMGLFADNFKLNYAQNDRKI